MDWSISADGFYIYPRANDTALGGTCEYHIDNELVDNVAIHLIIRGNKRILPHLDLDSVRGSYAGLRPYREGGVRLEAEEVGNKKVIHNYGHGGSGITLSWGSAKLALDLI
jgi:D-amino-acid oxidase